MPLVSKAFGDIITFTRASTATYFDATGTLQSAAIDAPRFDYDPDTLAARGFLIEEARTNLVLQSQDFATTWTTSASPTITTNTTVAPDGTTTADTIGATSTSSYVAQIFTFTGDGTKTYSFFIKAGTSSTTRISIRDTTAAVSRGQADITWTGGVPSAVVTNGSLQSLQACPNGWYRLAVIVDSVVAANTNQIRIQPDNVSGTGDVILWGAQVENGAFSTSYIPTTTTALTRSADVASVNTLSPWFNSTEYTLYYEGMVLTNTDSIVYSGLGDTFDNTSYFSRAAPNQLAGIRSGGVSSALMTVNFSPSSSVVFRQAMGVKADDFAFCINGGSVAVDTLGPVPASAVRLGIGNAPWSASGGSQRQQWIRRITYYPRRLSNAELQGITA